MNPLRSSTPLAHSASEIHFRRPYHHEPYMHYSPNGMSSKLMDSVTEQVLRPELDRKTSLPVMRSASSAGGEPSAMTKNQSHPSKRHSTYLWKSVMTPVQLVSVRQGKQEVCSEILMVANTDIPLKDLREFLASSLGGNADQIETLECSSGSWNEDTVWIGIPDSRTLWKQLAGGIKCYRVKWKDTSDAPTWGSSRENHGLSRVPSRSVPSTPLMMESSEDEEVPEVSINTSAEEDIEREQKIRRKHQRMLINQLGARTDPRDQISSESSDDEVDYNDMRDERQLNVVLERERNNYSKIIHREKISAENLAKTKDTMRSLIVRISHYKAMLEQDKEGLSRKFADLEKIRRDIVSQNATLRNERSEVMVDLKENRDELQDYQDQHDEIVQKERDDIQTIKRQDTAALMTYMKDIEELEEMNEMLTKEDESYHTKIRVIRSKHAKILADYISEKEKSEFIKKKSEGISQINDSLVQQIRRFQSEPMTMESRRAIQHVTEEAEAAITKILDTSTENEENDHRSHRTDISESIGRRVSVVDDDLQREAMFILKSSATSEGGNVMESYVTVSCLDPQQGEKAQVRCMTALDDIIWTGYSDGCIRLYHMETGELLEERRGHTASILDIKAIRQDSVWTSSKDKTICIWSPQKHQALKKLATTICNSMAEVESEVWASGIDGSIRIFDSKNGKTKKELKDCGATCLLTRLTRVWSGTETDILVWNSTTHKVTQQLRGHERTINALCNVGPYEVWSSSSDKTLRCWNAETYQCLRLLHYDNRIQCMFEIRATGTVWCGTFDVVVCMWNAKTYEMVTEFRTKHKNGGVNGMLLDSRDRVWTAGSDGLIYVWQRRSEVIGAHRKSAMLNQDVMNDPNALTNTTPSVSSFDMSPDFVVTSPTNERLEYLSATPPQLQKTASRASFSLKRLTSFIHRNNQS